MKITDPIADLLTRIRNAYRARHATVEVPASRLKRAIVDLLVREGYLQGMEQIDDPRQGILKMTMKYDSERRSVIRGMERVSKPGCRIYCSAATLPRVRQGVGMAILSTSKGVMSDGEARKSNIGGEYLCRVW